MQAFHPSVQEWFASSFSAPTRAQSLAWPALTRGESTLLLAPTGSGKTLAAFLHCLDRLMFRDAPAQGGCRVLYVSPIKALTVDVERNLRAPIAGIRRVAEGRGEDARVPQVAVRTGDTAQKDRARFIRDPAEILVTTPESLYLLLTSNARKSLESVETVIIDEIHALAPTKRGAHLALSLERLERLVGKPVQRIGLSATQRPLDEVARYLGGATASEGFRPVTIIDASDKKKLSLRIEVPVEDMAKLSEPQEIPSGAASQGPTRSSIWSHIHPRLLELVKSHQSTLFFVNSRRIAERIAAALNELAGETLVHAHHGSLARDQRALIEDMLKAGTLKGLVATSSLELGIDMGAIDLVVLIEAPPTVASGLQRIGRAGHQVGGQSDGVIFPKFRGDLVACAALADAMEEGAVEATFYPRNPLDVLAQQLVAITALESFDVEALYALCRQAAPFAELSRATFENVLDMLAGRYQSDDFADLKPRLTWDRLKNTVTAREGAKRLAIVNGGTIPDRGLYGVFLAGAPKGAARVGELDEEMVFESKPGETFVLGASTWRIEEITHDRVLVSAAPGQPGKMPFWRGENAGRSLEFGRRVGKLLRTVSSLPAPAALELLMRQHHLSETAAKNLIAYVQDQKAASSVPDDTRLVVERSRDELGDWRICVLSPLGGQVLAPWAMAIAARVREEHGLEVETMWSNDGFVVRFPESDVAPDPSVLLPPSGDVEALVTRQLSQTPLFAARFREAAGRALLLPRRRPGGRTPLWQQRKRAADLLEAASKYPAFPMLLEAYRECLRDVFDLPALVETLKGLESRAIKLVVNDPQTPSPFASSLLFGYVANYIYDGDAPLAERRAQALTVDPLQLKELLGDAELRELLDADVLHEVEAQLQLKDEQAKARNKDGLHDVLLKLGDLTRAELAERTVSPEVAAEVDALVKDKRVVELKIAGEARFVAVEQAARYRDALGVPLPLGLPSALLAPVPDAMHELLMRYARTHAPFPASEPAARFGLTPVGVTRALTALVKAGRLIEGAFRPGGLEREWCDREVLARARRRSLARLRREIEPVEPAAFGRLLASWHGVTRRRRGLDATLDVIEKLQGTPLPASMLETEILPARIEQYLPSDLDALAAAGEVLWVGIEPIGEKDGRVALYLTEHLPRLHRPPPFDEDALKPREKQVIDRLRTRGASFFADLHAACGGGFPGETLDALWSLVWRGLITNDSFFALRALYRKSERQGRREGLDGRAFRSRRVVSPGAEGRWALVESRTLDPVTPTERTHALAQQLLNRYGLVTREVGSAEGIPGGFSAVSAVFSALEEAGKARRGYFVSGVGAMQFAQPSVLELLRSFRTPPPSPEVVLLSAVDPANPYGALLPWPALQGVDPDKARGVAGPTRSAGAQVVIVDGALVLWISRGGQRAFAWLPEDELDREKVMKAIAAQLAQRGGRRLDRHEGLLLEINGQPATEHPLAAALEAAGFRKTASGIQARREISGTRGRRA